MIDTISARDTFANLRKFGISVRQGPIRLVFLEAEELEVAFSLHKSLGKAVKRNKLIRQMKSALVDINKITPLVPGAYQFKANKLALELPYDQLAEILHSLLETNGRLRSEN